MKYLIKLIALVFIVSQVKGQNALGFFPKENLITTGIYYYPEQWSENQWDRDIKTIAEMGFEFVHIAEFAWFKMEPVEGKYEFSWLDKVVQLCEKYHLKIVMCTPSAITPTWVRVNYPETFIMYGNYIRGENGTRGLGSIVNTKYRMFVKNIVTEMAKRYGKNKNITGWQLDNEPPAIPDYSPSSQEAFRQWLKKKYTTIDALNIAWGAAFWSQWLNNFEQVIIPNTTLVGWWGNNPHALLDFKRYCADAQADFLDFQATILRNNILHTQYITTNYTAVCTGADARRTKKLDLATYTAYPNGGNANLGEQGFRLGNHKDVLFASAFYKSVGDITGVMEMQIGPVGWGTYNSQLLPGTLRMWLYHNFGAGAQLACSYRFRQPLFGAEQNEVSIIKTDGVTASQGGEEYMQFNKEMQELRKQYQPNAKMPEKLLSKSTAILWNLENYWSIDRQKITQQWDAWNYPIKFLEITKSLGAPTDVIAETDDFSKYRFLIVPAYDLVDSALVKKWETYVANGGNLIVTCRTATKSRDGHYWEAAIAAPISTLIGAKINVSDKLPGNGNGDIVMKSNHYHWNNWGDLLIPGKNTTVLATYDNQFYKGTAAVVKNIIDKGTVTYIGVDTDDGKLEKDIIREIFANAGALTDDFPPGVFVYWRDGFYVAVNYSSNNYTMDIPGTAKILVGEKILKPAGVCVWSE